MSDLASKPIDILSFELVRHGLAEIADEMMTTLFRTGRSVNTTQALDCSAGIANKQGELLAQALALPGHLGTFPGVMKVVLSHFANDIHPGDVYASNDPYTVGLHLPDIVVVRPLFVKKALFGFALTVVHHVDIGGLVPGGMPTYATEVYQEGLRIPPLKLYDRGRQNKTLIEIIRKNVRVPDKVLGDLRGQAAACYVAEKKIELLAEEYGLERLELQTRQLLDYTERLARDEIASWPPGKYHFSDQVDDDGMGHGPIVIRLALTVQKDSIDLDFTDSDPQVEGPINCPVHSTFAGALTAIRCVLSPIVPTNSGLFRLVSLKTRPGTIVDPREPAATCNRALTLARVADVVFGALAQVVPDRTPACSESMTSPMTWSTVGASGETLVWVDNHISGRGGCPTMDAQEGIAPWVYNANNTSVEVTEASFPLRIVKFGFVASSGGPGKYRGGLCTERTYQVLSDSAMLTFRSDRHTSRPWGLCGGVAGSHSKVTVVRDGEPIETPPKFTRKLKKGDLVHSVMQSGGGWGNPMERDPAAVLKDYLEEKIDLGHARDDYGVEIDPVSRKVDLAATLNRRAN